ncbi:hypothetical protein [Mycobacteroides abscessus]|uniref:hypothetical protein n=1 Tax=Mycobacteroides abscessus TaxID=36809 RepID=UPI0019CF5B8D|nr:hypothetical protein [Mycobacteroides abscessus]MBN7481019.1 hypothetical protein [Mycobacteroides abscessus subsp. massiliense]
MAARKVTAIDSTVFYASVATLVEGESKPRCGRVIAPDRDPDEPQHLAAEHQRHIALAARIVAAVTKSGNPDLVVLRRPNFGTGAGDRKPGTRKVGHGSQRREVKVDTSALRRLAVHWELVRQFSEHGVPVAELGLISAEQALTGTVAGYSALVKATRSLYPEMTVPKTDDGMREDPRYRVTTAALAVLGAVALRIPTPLAVTEMVWSALRKGGDFPPSVRLPEAVSTTTAGTARAAEKARRVAKFYEREEERIGEMSFGDLESMGRPRNAQLADVWARRMRELGGEV